MEPCQDVSSCQDSFMKSLREEWSCCPICHETYNADKKPRTTRCGHNLCTICLQNLIRVMSEPKCCLCQANISSTLEENPVNYSILDIACMLGASGSAPKTQVIRIKCNDCKEDEKQERMKLCLSCAGEMGYNESSNDDEMQPFVFCAYCIDENHNEHRKIKYLPYKIQNLVEYAATNSSQQVKDMHDLCDSISQDITKKVASWGKNLTDITKKGAHVNWTTVPFLEAKAIAKGLRDEAETLTSASDKVIRELRMFQKKCEDSTLVVQKLLENIEITQKEKTTPRQNPPNPPPAKHAPVQRSKVVMLDEIPSPSKTDDGSISNSSTAGDDSTTSTQLKKLTFVKNPHVELGGKIQDIEGIYTVDEVTELLSTLRRQSNDVLSFRGGSASSFSVIGRPGKVYRKVQLKCFTPCNVQVPDRKVDFKDDLEDKDRDQQRLVTEYMENNSVNLKLTPNQIVRDIIRATGVTSGAFLIYCQENPELLKEAFSHLTKYFNNGMMSLSEPVYINYSTYKDKHRHTRIKVYSMESHFIVFNAIQEALSGDMFLAKAYPVQINYKLDILKKIDLRRLCEDSDGVHKGRVSTARVNLCDDKKVFESFENLIDGFLPFKERLNGF